MASHERPIAKASIASSALLQQLAAILPKDISFKIYHLSTPPTKTSAIYSAPPGARPNRTYCESHFLTASIETSSKENAFDKLEVLVYAIEILIYSTAYDTTFFVSKADSTGYLHLLDLKKGTPSPIRDISATFLHHLIDQRQRPNIRSVISLFARAQDQYLFPGSVEYSGKHVLDDRGLVRWWCRVLDPLIEESRNSVLSNTSQPEAVRGYLIVPGLDTHETLSYVPKRQNSSNSWTIGHPLLEISRHPAEVPPRCLIPHFPDDPKARFLDELDDETSKDRDGSSGQWKSVRTIDQFWDMMAFRQECSAGRLVGFIWIVFTPKAQNKPTEGLGDIKNTAVTAGSQMLDTGSQSYPVNPGTSFTEPGQIQPVISPLKKGKEDEMAASQQSTQTPRPKTTKKKKKLVGPIIPRLPRIKTENKNYLLERPETSPYYIWPREERSQVIVDESGYNRITELLLRLDFANLKLASSSSARWINEVRSGASGNMKDAWGQTVTGTKAVEAQSQTGSAGVNTLNMGLVRKKRKDGVDQATVPTPDLPQINILSARKKAKT